MSSTAPSSGLIDLKRPIALERISSSFTEMRRGIIDLLDFNFFSFIPTLLFWITLPVWYPIYLVFVLLANRAIASLRAAIELQKAEIHQIRQNLDNSQEESRQVIEIDLEEYKELKAQQDDLTPFIPYIEDRMNYLEANASRFFFDRTWWNLYDCLIQAYKNNHEFAGFLDIGAEDIPGFTHLGEDTLWQRRVKAYNYRA